MPQSPRGAFFLHWFRFLCLAAEARTEADRAGTENPQAYPAREALSAILFSALAAEAFINELGEAAARDTYSLKGVGPPGFSVPGTDDLTDLAEVLDTIEEEHGPLELKYLMTSQVLTGHAFDRGKAPFQDFSLLVHLRNDLVHPRHRDRTQQGYIEPQSSVVRDLQGRGLTNTKGRKPPEPRGGTSWLDEISCARTAAWAFETARDMIAAVLKMLPEDDRFTLIRFDRERLPIFGQL